MATSPPIITQPELELLCRQVPGLITLIEVFEKLSEINFCLKDLNGRYLEVNEGFMRTVHLTKKSQVLNKTAFDIYPELLAQRYHDQDQILLKGNENLYDQLEMITDEKGQLGWYITNKLLVRDAEGTVRAIVGTSKNLYAPQSDDARYDKLSIALTILQEQFHQPLRISTLAEKSGLSISQFGRLMQSLLGVTPRQYLTRIRVEAAARRLSEGDEPISEIAEQCGFSDQPSLSKQFRAITGYSPLQYRKMREQRS
ncbi:MAG: AraC family transcriptional regulator [Planctomycetaceae bacterium]|nr:AraC family transcriptional regulator [Planctomycetaceae bacterium]